MDPENYTSLGAMTPWVRRLIAANVVVFLFTMTKPALTYYLAFVPELALIEPWRFLTYMFVHSGTGHILFNMLALYIFGPQLEVRLGSRHFLGLYLAAGFTGALLSIPVGHPIVGASGAVFGVSLGFARYWPRVKLLIMGIFPMEAWQLVPLYVVISVMGTAGWVMPGVAHLAHLGGFVGAYIYLVIRERTSAAAKFRAQASPVRSKGDATDLERWKKINRDALHPVNREELDRVFGKIEAQGPGALAPDERAFLDRLS